MFCFSQKITVQEQNQVFLLQPLLQTFGKQPERMVFSREATVLQRSVL